VGQNPELVNSVDQLAGPARTLILTGLSQPGSPLTPRESDVLRAAAEGISTEQIGTRLHLSPTTVRNYLSNAIAKVGGRNRIDTIRIARNAGWI
jgi:two-component system response regulator DesR